MYIDWLEIEPSELLRKLRGCDYPPSNANFFTKPKGNAQHYWIELKKAAGRRGEGRLRPHMEIHMRIGAG